MYMLVQWLFRLYGVRIAGLEPAPWKTSQQKQLSYFCPGMDLLTWTQRTDTSPFQPLQWCPLPDLKWMRFFKNKQDKDISDLPLKASIACCRVSSEMPLYPLAKTLILKAKSMRVRSGLRGFPTPVITQNNFTFRYKKKQTQTHTLIFLDKSF